MVELQENKKKLKKAGLKVVAVSYDELDVLEKFAGAKDISFLLLSDKGSTAIDAYGIRNNAMDGLTYGRYELTGVPHPGTYVLDTKGIVRAKLFKEKYQERHEIDELLAAAKRIH